MSDASELLREAQYALQNVSYGSTDSKKHAAEAKSLARRIIRKYPDSREVAAAWSILEQLGERVPAPTAQDQQVHAASVEHYQSHPRADVRTESRKLQYLLPGWPLRLAQAIPVVVGVFLIMREIGPILWSRPDIESLLSLLAGGLLVYFPRMDAFTSLVSQAKTKVFVEEDWYAKVDHLPTAKDIEELVSAGLQGNKNKLLILIVTLFFLSGFFVTFAAVFYVIGARKAFDTIEGWLLDRNGADADGELVQAGATTDVEHLQRSNRKTSFKWVPYVLIGVPVMLGIAALAIVVTAASGEGVGTFLLLVLIGGVAAFVKVGWWLS